MNEKVAKSLDTMLENWRVMSESDLDDAAGDANRFESSFYEMMDEVRAWIGSLDNKPHTLDEALAMPEVQAIQEQLPGPLLLNFETELELIVEGIVREPDAKYE